MEDKQGSKEGDLSEDIRITNKQDRKTLENVQSAIWDIMRELAQVSNLSVRVSSLESLMTEVKREHEKNLFERSQLKESQDALRSEFKSLSIAFDELESALELNTETNRAQLDVIHTTVSSLKESVDKLSIVVDKISATQEQNKEVIAKTRLYFTIGKFIAENKTAIISSVMALIGFGAGLQAIIDKYLK